MLYYTLYLQWSTFYNLCFLVDHSFPSVVFPFVNPTKYALFSFIIQLIVYTCDIPINHCVIIISYKLYNKFYVNVYFVKYFIPLLLMEINPNWIELNWKQVGNQSANGRQLFGDQLKTRKTYRPVWGAKGFRCSCKNLQPTKIYNNQWQPFADFKKPFYSLSQPTAEHTFLMGCRN